MLRTGTTLVFMKRLWNYSVMNEFVVYLFTYFYINLFYLVADVLIYLFTRLVIYIGLSIYILPIYLFIYLFI